MLVANIEDCVKEIIEKNGKGGWMRVNECSKKYAQKNPSLETKFYRWLKKVEKGKIKGFQSLSLPKNISFIGLELADPRAIESFISEDKKITRSIKAGFGFSEWWDRRAIREQRERLLIHKEKLLRAAQYCELVVKYNPHAAAFLDLAKNYREEIKELDKELDLE
jgi:hypothetical protein